MLTFIGIPDKEALTLAEKFIVTNDLNEIKVYLDYFYNQEKKRKKKRNCAKKKIFFTSLFLFYQFLWKLLM